MKTKMTKHHRKSKFFGGTNDKENISIVPENTHKAFHLLFNTADPQHIADVLNKTWIDPRYKLIVVKREIVDPAQLTLFPNKKPR